MRTVKQTIVHLDPGDRLSVWVGGVKVYFDCVEPDAPLVEIEAGGNPLHITYNVGREEARGLGFTYGLVRRAEKVPTVLERHANLGEAPYDTDAE